MTDVIDALKRLERVGSEHSRTTEKLIQAAKELERKIVSQFDAENENYIPVTQSAEFGSREYLIIDGNLFRGSQLRGKQHVSSSRTNAMKFAEDIANGLLQEIINTLDSRKPETETAVSLLEHALTKPWGPKMTDELRDLTLSIEAQKLIYDLAKDCQVSRTGGGAPGIVTPRAGGTQPQTKGQVGDSAIEELVDHQLVHQFGEGFPRACKLTAKGEAYYELILKKSATRT